MPLIGSKRDTPPATTAWNADDGSAALLSPRSFRTALLLTFLAGTVFRVCQYLSRRSFWEDESFLVLNLLHKSAAALMGRLDYSQAAPPLFLLAERAAVAAWGGSEFSLRLLPLAAGLASIALMIAAASRIAHAVLDRRSAQLATLAAVALLAASNALIWRASEAKPYSSDALAALVLLIAALPGRADTAAKTRLARLSIAAAGLIWFSYPAVFVFAGLSLTLLPAVLRDTPTPVIGGSPVPTRQASWRGLLLYAGWSLIVVVSFIAMYVAVIRNQQSDALSDFWIKDFGDITRPLAFVGWIAGRSYDLCHSACEPLGPVILPLSVVGGIALFRSRHRQLLAVLVLPVLVTIAAACARRYPFDGKRMTTFLIPTVILLASIGFAAAVIHLRAAGRRRDIFALVAVLAAPVALCAYHLPFPRTRAHVRPAVDFVAARYQPGDEVYCSPLPTQLLCYWPPSGAAAGSPPRPLSSLGKATLPARRFWVVFAFAPEDDDEEELARLMAPARAAGTVRDQFIGHGGAAYLVEAHVPSTRPNGSATKGSPP